jgi:hypothetical protein
VHRKRLKATYIEPSGYGGRKKLTERRRDQKKEITETYGSQQLYGLYIKLAKLSLTLICIHPPAFSAPRIIPLPKRYHMATSGSHASIQLGGPKIQEALPRMDYSILEDIGTHGEEGIGLWSVQ